MTIEHLDEKGQPCALHAKATIEQLLALAIVGSRTPGFHHDVASKLQGLMMSLDEISELAEKDQQISRAAEAALDALREVLELLKVNRALAKPPTRTAVTLRELLDLAAARVYVALDGPIVDATLHVAAPRMMHALSLALDAAGGPGRGRALSMSSRIDGNHVELRLGWSSAAPSDSAESLAIATFVLECEGGSLRCAEAGSHLILRLPVSAM